MTRVNTRLEATRRIAGTRIARRGITPLNIAYNSIDTDHLFDGCITAPKLATGAVTNAKIQAEAITTDKVAQAAITASLIGDAYKILEIVDALPAFGTAGRIVFLTTDGKIYRDNGSAWVELIMPASVYEHIGGAGENQIVTDQIVAGAVTADILAANAVIADKIAANAVISEKIAASQILTDHLAAGAITVDKISVGAFANIGYRNLIINGSFNADVAGTADPKHWTHVSSGTYYYKATWEPEPFETWGLSPFDFTYYVRQYSGDNDGNGYAALTGDEYIPVDRDKGYTLSIYARKMYAADATKWYLGLNFYDQDKVVCSPTSYGYPSSTDGVTTTPASWTRYSGTFGPDAVDYDVEFPTDCYYVTIRFYPMWHPTAAYNAGGNFTGLQLEEGVLLTAWSPFIPNENWASDTDATYIDGGRIYANSIVLAGLASGVTDRMFDSANTSDNIQAWAHTSDVTMIDGGDIYANSIVLAKLASTVTDRMFDSSSKSDDIQAWCHAADATYIDGGKIYTNTVTATQINVGTLSALTADMGTLTAGKIDVGSIEINATTERILFGAASAPTTGAGIFMGKDGSDYEFRVGNPSGSWMHWDGSDLKLYYGGGSNDITAQELQEGAARARSYIQGTPYAGGYQGMLMNDETGFYWSGTCYKISLEAKGTGNIYYLIIDTDVEGGGGGSGDSCFAENTMILMDDFTEKRISDIKVGDYVLTRELEDCPQLVRARVLNVLEHDDVDDIWLINGFLEVTPNHLLYVNDSWKRVDQLRIGNLLVTDSGQYVSVVSIQQLAVRKQTVYNLEIDKHRTYFADGIYVHNAKGIG